jgi:hypothetical protein
MGTQNQCTMGSLFWRFIEWTQTAPTKLKWLIKTYETTNKAKFFNPFLQNWPETKLNNKLKTESQKLTLERAGKPV